MLQLPIAVGLKVCEHFVVQEKTRNVTLVNCLRKLRFREFPSPPQTLAVCAVLTDGRGETRLSLAVSPLSTGNDIWIRSWTADFHDPLQEKWFLIRMLDLSFSEPGRYEIVLTAEDEVIAQTALDVLYEEGLP